MAPFTSKIKMSDIFNFPSIKYLDKGLLFLNIWHIRVNYCYNYGPSNLLFRFSCYRLGHLNNRQTKIAENSTISFKFFDPPTTKWQPFNFFAKLNGNHILMASFSKLRKYQTFGLIELHNLSKGQLTDRIFKLWKSYVHDYRIIEHTTFEILTF